MWINCDRPRLQTDYTYELIVLHQLSIGQPRDSNPEPLGRDYSAKTTSAQFHEAVTAVATALNRPNYSQSYGLNSFIKFGTGHILINFNPLWCCRFVQHLFMNLRLAWTFQKIWHLTVGRWKMLDACEFWMFEIGLSSSILFSSVIVLIQW